MRFMFWQPSYSDCYQLARFFWQENVLLHNFWFQSCRFIIKEQSKNYDSGTVINYYVNDNWNYITEVFINSGVFIFIPVFVNKATVDYLFVILWTCIILAFSLRLTGFLVEMICMLVKLIGESEYFCEFLQIKSRLLHQPF